MADEICNNCQQRGHARCDSYLCMWCGWITQKDLWGPGRITCPHCGNIAPSVAEQEQCGENCDMAITHRCGGNCCLQKGHEEKHGKQCSCMMNHSCVSHTWWRF